ncbi:unnamed protein product, partial [Mesorhabditis spiculigera]
MAQPPAKPGLDRMPWYEKYRPTKLDDLVSHDNIVKSMRRYIKSRRMPNMIFYGPPGAGKTSTILSMAQEVYTAKHVSAFVLELNASEERGIETIRQRVHPFAATKSLHGDMKKIIILDEADGMTKDAQNALKRMIEKYSRNVSFCILCNHLSSIISAIQSRCVRFRFAPLSLEKIRPRLEYIIETEKVNVTNEGIEALFDVCEGDMRRALNVLQSATLIYDVVDEEAIYKAVAQPTPAHIRDIFKVLLNDTLADCCRKLQAECVSKSIAVVDIIKRLHDAVFELDMPPQVHIEILMALADVEKRLSIGGSEKVQLAGLCAAFMQARHLIALHA